MQFNGLCHFLFPVCDAKEHLEILFFHFTYFLLVLAMLVLWMLVWGVQKLILLFPLDLLIFF